MSRIGLTAIFLPLEGDNTIDEMLEEGGAKFELNGRVLHCSKASYSHARNEYEAFCKNWQPKKCLKDVDVRSTMEEKRDFGKRCLDARIFLHYNCYRGKEPSDQPERNHGELIEGLKRMIKNCSNWIANGNYRRPSGSWG